MQYPTTENPEILKSLIQCAVQDVFDTTLPGFQDKLVCQLRLELKDAPVTGVKASEGLSSSTVTQFVDDNYDKNRAFMSGLIGMCVASRKQTLGGLRLALVPKARLMVCCH